LRLHLAVLLFGASGLVGKAVSAPALSIACVRSLVACLVLALLTGLRRSWTLPCPGATCSAPAKSSGRDRGADNLVRHFPAGGVGRRGWLALLGCGRAGRRPAGVLLLLGGALLAAHWWSFFAAIQRSTVALGLLTFASYPLFAAVLGSLLLRERLRRTDALACAAVVAGLALVVPDWRFGSQGGQAAALGILSGLTFALLTLVNRRLTASLPALVLVGAQTGVAGLLLLPVAAGQFGAMPARDWLLLLALGVVSTALAHACFAAALKQVRVATAGVTTALEPVYGIAFAWLLLGERPALAMLAGGLLIIGAAALGATAKDSFATD